LLIGSVMLAGCNMSRAPAPPVAAAVPGRIVSMNPCVDAVLQEVAAPDQIAAISHYSHDPRATSVPLDWAQAYPAVSGNAEDVIAAEPDLVIAGPHVSIQTISALNRLHIPLMQLTVPESVAENKAQISAIAARIGRAEAGRMLNARIDAAMAKARWHGPETSALIWQGSGLVPGRGTLADALMTHSGFRNLSPVLHLKQWDRLPLEGLLNDPPAVVLAGLANMGAGDGDTNRMLSHPVLHKAGMQLRIAHYPSNLLHCGGPVIIRSLARLATVRRSLEQHP
jgi:iron complex transport system substrate-binding protein